MKKFLQLILIIVSIITVCDLTAEVYLLGRGLRCGTAGKFSGTDGRPLYTETVVTNGRKFELEIYQGSQRIDEIYQRLLRERNKNTSVSTNGKMVRYRSELANKMVEHLLFVDSGKETLIFRILLPQNFSAGKSWHPELPPLPGGAKSELVLELPQRNSILGLFNNAFGTPQGNLRAVLSNLSDQWYVSADESTMANGRGAMLTGKKRGIMLVGFSDDGTGFFYLKK